eukprot:5988093-Alexandrium_andersonii.AAC.1
MRVPADTRARQSLGSPQLVPAPQPASAGRPPGYSPPLPHACFPRADPGLACHRLPPDPGCSYLAVPTIPRVACLRLPPFLR